MLKNEDEAWQLFETLNENSLHHIFFSCRYKPMFAQKRGRIYEVGNFIDIHNKIDELSQKLDRLLNVGHSSAPFFSTQDVYASCSSHTHFMSECPVTLQFFLFAQEKDQQAQTQIAFKSGNNPFSNTYNSSWRNYPNFSYKPQSVVNPIMQRSSHPDATYRHMPYPQFQNVPPSTLMTHNLTFE